MSKIEFDNKSNNSADLNCSNSQASKKFLKGISDYNLSSQDQAQVKHQFQQTQEQKEPTQKRRRSRKYSEQTYFEESKQPLKVTWNKSNKKEENGCKTKIEEVQAKYDLCWKGELKKIQYMEQYVLTSQCQPKIAQNSRNSKNGRIDLNRQLPPIVRNNRKRDIIKIQQLQTKSNIDKDTIKAQDNSLVQLACKNQISMDDQHHDQDKYNGYSNQQKIPVQNIRKHRDHNGDAETQYHAEQVEHNRIPVNNYVGNDENGSQGENRCNRSFIIKISLLSTLILAIIGGIIAVAVHFSQSSEEVVPPDTIVVPQIIQSKFIVERKYEKNEVYKLEYTINTQMSQNYTIRIIYTVFIVSKGSYLGQNNSIYYNFSASSQKRSQQQISPNGTVEKTQIYDQSDIYENILKLGNNDIQENKNNQTNSNEEELMTCEQVQAQLNQTIQCTASVISVFDFSLQQNGKIDKFTFPKEMQRQSLGLLRTFVKMFSPLLDKNLYADQSTPKLKSKKLGANPLFLGESNNNETNNSYSESSMYSASQTEDSLVLNNQENVDSQSDTHNSHEQTTQQSTFSNNRLTQTSLSSDSDFQSPQDSNDTSNESMYSAEPTNMNLNFSSHQQCKLRVIQEFIAEDEHVQMFQGFLTSYKTKNETATLSVEELINFILGIDSQNQARAGEYRLLLQRDGSLSLIKYDKTIKILTTNVIGFKLGAFGYLKLNLNLHQDPNNPNKKQPIFKVDIGTILALGFSQVPFSLLDYEKKMPPLTLKFTLQKLETVFDLVKGGFIQQLISISQMILNGEFQNEMLPKIFNIVSTIGNLTTVIDEEATRNSPLSILNQIFEIISNMESVYESKGLSLLSSDNELIGNLSVNLLQYVNLTYEQALQAFSATKNTLSDIRSQSFDYFNEMKRVFLNRNISEISSLVQNLIPAQVYDSYTEQIRKAQIILNTISYVQQNGLLYVNNVQEIVNNHQTNLLALIENVLNLYFDNQTNIANIFNQSFIHELNVEKQALNGIKRLFPTFQQISEVSQNYLQSIITATNIGSDSHRLNFTNFLSDIGSSANGASGERFQGCCEYKRFLGIKTGCKYYNSGAGNQAAQPVIWNVTRTQIEAFIMNTTTAAQQFIQNATATLNDANLSIPDKVMRLQEKYYQSIARYPLSLTSLLQRINENLAQSRNALNSVRCGATNHLQNLIARLQALKTSLSNYDGILNTFNQAYINITSSFNTSVYNRINEESKLTESSRNFLDSYQHHVANITSIFNRLKVITQTFNPQNFVKNTQLASQLFSIYGQAISVIQSQCQNKEANAQQVQQIRREYLDKLNNISQITSVPLSDQLHKLRNFLNTSSSNIFHKFLSTPFCEMSQKFHHNISTLYPDFDNFTILFELWKDFKSIKVNAQRQISDIKLEWQKMRGNFYQLFTPQGYQKFVYSTSNLTNLLVTFVTNMSIEFSNIREASMQVLAFQSGTQNQLTQAFQIFVNSAFQLRPQSMYPNITQLIEQSLTVIQQLGFDVITVVVAGNNIKQYFEDIIVEFRDGVDKVKSQFLLLCQSFISLDRIVTQDYLNNIDQDFRNIIGTLNHTIFPNISVGVKQIKQKFQNYEFQSQYLQNIFTGGMDTLDKISRLMDETRDNVYSVMKDFSDSVLQLINKLEIGSLNSLYQLGNVVKQQFEKLINLFKIIVKKILQFPKFVIEDFRNLYKLSEYIDDIKLQVKDTLQQIDSNIRQQVNETLNYLEDNSEFYDKLKNSGLEQSLRNLIQTGLKVNFDNLWSSDEVVSKLQSIQTLVKSISGNLQEFLENLSSAKNKIKQIKENVDQRIKNIKNEFNVLKRKFSSLKSLVFISLSADLSGVVMTSINRIMVDIDGIVDIDLHAVGRLAQSQIDVPVIRQMINDAVGLYSGVKQKRTVLMDSLHNALMKVDQFLHSSISTKVQKLKDGILFIKSQSNLQDPVNNFVLYQKQLLNKRMPIFRYKQIIPTAIGTFLISLDLNFTISGTFFINLRQYRNIDIGTTFTAALVLDVAFGYGIAYILQFGLYVRGTILYATIKPQFLLNNVIPYQLVNAIADLPDISRDNIIKVYFVTDLTIGAFALQIGFYIKHIWIELIWIQIRFCIKIFRSFCFTFRIPIGFTFTFKRHDFGLNIQGITLVEQRIIDLKILEFQA